MRQNNVQPEVKEYTTTTQMEHEKGDHDREKEENSHCMGKICMKRDCAQYND